VFLGQENLEAVPGKAAVALISLLPPAGVGTKEWPRGIVEVRLRPSKFAVRVIPRMETPYPVEGNDGFPVTIEVEGSRIFGGSLRTDAREGATLKKEHRNPKASKIWMGRQDRPQAFRSFA
jgi:hypothetical protein